MQFQLGLAGGGEGSKKASYFVLGSNLNIVFLSRIFPVPIFTPTEGINSLQSEVRRSIIASRTAHQYANSETAYRQLVSSNPGQSGSQTMDHFRGQLRRRPPTSDCCQGRTIQCLTSGGCSCQVCPLCGHRCWL